MFFKKKETKIETSDKSIKLSYEDAKKVAYRITNCFCSQRYAEQTGTRHLIIQYALSMPISHFYKCKNKDLDELIGQINSHANEDGFITKECMRYKCGFKVKIRTYLEDHYNKDNPLFCASCIHLLYCTRDALAEARNITDYAGIKAIELFVARQLINN